MIEQDRVRSFDTWVSGDGQTPIQEGDRVTHVDAETGVSREGVVMQRIIHHPTRGYGYSDYVYVKFRKADGSYTNWTNVTSRYLTINGTAGHTDGSERQFIPLTEPRRPWAQVAPRGQRPTEPLNTTPTTPARPATPSTDSRTGGQTININGTQTPVHINSTTTLEHRDMVTDGTVQTGDLLPVAKNGANNGLAEVVSIEDLGNGRERIHFVQAGADGAPMTDYFDRTGNFPAIVTYRDPNAGNDTAIDSNQLNRVFHAYQNANASQMSGDLHRRAINAIASTPDNSPYNRQQLDDIARELEAISESSAPTPEENAQAVSDVAEAVANDNPEESADLQNTINEAVLRNAQINGDGLADWERERLAESTPPATETPAAPAAPAAPTPSAPTSTTNPNANPEAMSGTQVIDEAWLDEATPGIFIYSTSSSWVYKKDTDGTWKRFEGGRTTGSADMSLLRSRINSGQLFVGNTVPTSLPPESQTTSAATREPALPSTLPTITPDVSGGWADVSAGTQINNPDWFSGAPTGTQVGLQGMKFEKKEDGQWYPTSGDFTSTGYSSEDFGTLGLLLRSEQEAPSGTPVAPTTWELLPDGTVISDSSYIDQAPTATRISLQMSDGSAPRTFVKLGTGKWEREGTPVTYSNEQINYRLNNSGAHTFTSLPPADTSEVSTTVSSLSELRAFPVGTRLNGRTAGGGVRRTFERRENGKWAMLDRYNRATREWDAARVMQFIRGGGVINNGNRPNQFAPTTTQPTQQRTATTRSGAVATQRGGGITPITYTPGSFETDVTPEQFHQIISTRNSQALKRLLEQQFSGRMLGNYQLRNIHVSGSGFEADIADANGNQVGRTERSFTANSDGTVGVYNALMSISSTSNRGGGFSSNYTEALYDMYRKLGVTNVRVTANIDDGGYAWGVAGFDFADDVVPSTMTGRMQSQLSLAIRDGRMQDAMRLNDLLQRSLRRGSNRPTANEIATVAGQLDFYPGYGGTLGRELMMHTGWGGKRRVSTLEESIAFFDSIRRKNEERQRRQQHNGGN